MRIHQQVIVLVFVLAVVGDIGSFINSAWTGSKLVSHNGNLLLPGTDAVVGIVAKAAAKALSKVAKTCTRKIAKKAASEHTKNKRPSTKKKHEKGQSRKKKDQERATNKRQKGGKDKSKKRGKKG
jgi:hypothetical protein